MKDFNRSLDAAQVRDFFNNAPKEYQDEFMEYLEQLILDLEQEDFFGTEGFNWRFK